MKPTKIIFLDGPIPVIQNKIIDGILEQYSHRKVKIYHPMSFIDKSTLKTSEDPLAILVNGFNTMLYSIMRDQEYERVDIDIVNGHIPQLFFKYYLLSENKDSFDATSDFSLFLNLVNKYKNITRASYATTVYTGITFEDEVDCLLAIRKLKNDEFEDSYTTVEDAKRVYLYKKYYNLYKTIFVGNKLDYYLTQDTVIDENLIRNIVGL
jgi:hypothetical protein